MNDAQWIEFDHIAQQCKAGVDSINVASQGRRDAIVAAWNELIRLQSINDDLLAAAEHVSYMLHCLLDKEYFAVTGWLGDPLHLEQLDAAIARMKGTENVCGI